MSFEDILLYVLLPVMLFAIAGTLFRLLRGPALPDRVVALDLMTTIGIGIIVLLAMATDQPELLDVAVVVALTAFLGTIAFAYYIEERGRE
ncbi:MAG: cation:proton antiporter [Chloroflexi bacterium]|nr:cation:proton antiporter [Chloroflexota bacterium]